MTTRDEAVQSTPRMSPWTHVHVQFPRAQFPRAMLNLVLGFFAFATVASWLASVQYLFLDPHSGTYDFAQYLTVSVMLRENLHAHIYSMNLLDFATAHHIPPFEAGGKPYPPPLHLLLIPLTFMPFSTAARAWLVLNLLFWAVGTVLLIDWTRRELVEEIPARAMPGLRNLPRVVAIITLFMATAYIPALDSLWLGQASILIFFLVVLAAWLDQRGHPFWAGTALSLAVWIKLYPLILVAYFLFRGRRRVVVGAFAGMAFILVLSTALVGVSTMLAMTGTILGVASAIGAHYHNEALDRVPFWIAVELGRSPGSRTMLLGKLLAAAVGLTFVGTLLQVWRHRDKHTFRQVATANLERTRADALGYAWALCTMVLVVPVTWEHYDAWLLPAFAVCFGHALLAFSRLPRFSRRSCGRWLRTALVLAGIMCGYVLTMYSLPFGYEGDLLFNIGPFASGHPLRPLFMVVRPVGALLLWGAAGLQFTETARAAATPEENGRAATPGTEPARHLEVRLLVVLAVLIVAAVLWRTLFINLTAHFGAPYDVGRA